MSLVSRRLVSCLALVTALGFAPLTAAVAANSSPPLSAEQQAAVRELVGQTLRDNPQIVVDALDAYQTKQQEAENKNREGAIATLADWVKKNEGRLSVLGNPKASVTVVEFYDYNCGYCRRMASQIQDLLKADKDVRWVFVDFPILSPASAVAARAAMAAEEQGKFEAFHFALMNHSGAIDEAAILKVAKDVKLDIAKFNTFRANEGLVRAIDQNMRMGQDLGVRGTPSMVVGKEFVGGALSKEDLAAKVATARKAAKGS